MTTGWLEPDVRWSDDDTHDFMLAIEADTDRLHALVENLLDMSRLQSGVLNLDRRAVGLDEVVPAALASLGNRARNVVVDVPETLPRVRVDAALLERAIANVVDNAIRHSSSGQSVRIEGGAIGGRVDLRVVDRGSGISPAQRVRLFQPFQRLGDTDTHNGVGLGLAVAKGFVEAVGGDISVDDTPGGGITMVLSFPIASDGEPAVRPALARSPSDRVESPLIEGEL
jgi:two-component system sensor histidine kinase KdpD